MAAALVFAATVATAGCAERARGAAPSGFSPEPSIEVDGERLPYAGPQAWTSASVPSPVSTELTVFAVGSAEGGDGCSPPVVRVLTQETADEVRVLVADYEREPEPQQPCGAIAFGPTPQAVQLREPIGERRLVDAADGRWEPPLIGTALPTLEAPPAGYSEAALQRMTYPRRVERHWMTDADAGSQIVLTIGTPADLRDLHPYGEVVERFTIDGVAATVFRESRSFLVQWTPNPQQTLRLHLVEGTGPTWTERQAVRLARTVTGYTVEAAEERLPTPDVPGTVAAVWSSADGPVRQSEQLLKSSVVHIGVHCLGVGTVSVTVRGETFPFDCTDELTEFRARSVGEPDEPFEVDIDATEGVQWTVALARGSPDGT